MKVLTRNCLPKFGRTGFSVLGLDPRLDGTLIDDISTAVQHGSVLLLWHGDQLTDDVKSWLRTNAKLQILMLSQTQVVPKGADVEEFGPRVWGLPWGVKSLVSEQEWKDQPQWQRSLIQEFIRDVSRPEGGPPLWHLLEPPAVPEHIIACYLCSLADVEPETSWQTAFQNEVSYWIAGQNVMAKLDWNQDRTNKAKLREFLSAAGALKMAAESQVSNADA